jgi:phosphoglycolate phosphatase
VKALLLDLDRTLIDIQSYTDYAAALEDLTRELGEVAEVEVPATGWDSPTIRCMQILVALAGRPEWERASDLIERRELAALPSSQAMPGLGELFETLSGGLPVAVVTLLGPNATSQVLEMHGVDVPVTVPRRPDLRPKPAPDQLLEACRRLGVKPGETVMVGDSTWDQEAAAAAGAGFIGVTNSRPSEFPPGTKTVSDLGGLGLVDRRQRMGRDLMAPLSETEIDWLDADLG